ncbi:MAG: glycosyltransferase family 39 protein [Puniceicoccaceae bacterium]
MKQVIIFTIIGLLSAGLSFILGNHYARGGHIIYLTYPNLLLSFSLFVGGLFFLHRKEWNFKRLLPQTKGAWINVAGVSLLLLLLEPFEFKIIYDEVLMAVAAEMIHFSRIVGMATMANDYDGSYQFLLPLLEKRPFFFPFLVSLVHDISGYRYSNVFILNAILTPVFLILLNFLGKQFGGTKGGILAVLLAGTLPLLALMASSGNQDILNLVMLCLALVLSWLYLTSPTELRLIPLVYCLILFFQIRYENGVFLIPFGMLILMGWQRAKRPLLPWPVLLSPLFLILPSIHYFIVTNNSGRYFQSGPGGRESTFSIDYFSDNVGSAGTFLFSVGQGLPNSILLTMLGFSALLLFLYYAMVNSRKKRTATVASTILLFLMLGVVLHLSLVLLFNYGVFDSYLTARLSLPLNLLFILLVPFVYRRFGRRAIAATLAVSLVCLYFVFLNLPPEFLSTVGLQFLVAVMGFLILGAAVWLKRVPSVKAATIACLAYIIAIGLPVGHAQRYSKRANHNDTIMGELAFLKERENERILWVSSTPYAALLNQVNCLPITYAKDDPAKLKTYLEEDSYDSIYISRRMKRSPEESFALVDAIEEFDTGIFITEPVQTMKYNMTTKVEILRLVEVNLQGKHEEGK